MSVPCLNGVISKAVMMLLALCASFRCTSSFSPSRNVRSLQVRHHLPPLITVNTNARKTSGLYRTARVGGQGKSNIASTSALAAEPTAFLSGISAVGTGISKFYKAFPLVAGFLTCGTKAAFADSMAQYRDVCETKFNVKRNLAMVLYSGLILGVTVEIMYNKLFPLLFGTAEKGVLMAVKMTLFDGFINAPLFWLPPAYITQAIVYRYPKREAVQKYISDVKENGLLTKYWSLWLPASLINFLFVPEHFRVLFVACVSFFWMVILSLVANAGNEQDIESCPVEPEPKMLNPRALD